MTFDEFFGGNKMTDLNRLAERAFEHATRRMENGANISTETRCMLKHCATEVVEATEAYAKVAEHFECKGMQSFDYAGMFESELADIICCVLIIAGKEHIDIEKALVDCMEKNRKRAEGAGDKL